MFTKDRRCVFTTQYDPGNERWNVIQVMRDGNPINLGVFVSQEAAEVDAASWREAYEEWCVSRRREAAIELRMNRQED